MKLPYIIFVVLALAGCGGSTPPRQIQPIGNRSTAPIPAFEKTGTASYYGEKFKGRSTANGEKFDPAGFTAAHNSLPFGTRVRVTNVQNGRWVVVRINDRFGSHKGRVIDLSEGAFRKIADPRAGLANVSLEVVR